MSRSIGLCFASLLLVSLWACSPPAANPPAAPAQTASTPAAAPADSATPPAQAATTPTTPAPAETPTQQPASEPQSAALAGSPASPAGDPDAILRKVAEFYQQAQSLQVESEQAMEVTGAGIDNRMTTRRTIAAARPNQLAMRSTEGLGAFDIVSDGKELFISIPTMQRYSASPAPETFDELLTNPLLMGGAMSGQASFVTQLLADEPYKRLMEGVTSAEYLGTEDIGGVRAHHLRFIQDQFDWDLWTPVEGDPVLLQVSADMSKAMAQFGGGNEQLKNLKMVSIETFQNWKLNTPIDAVAFTFTPPEGAEKVDNLFEGLAGGGEEEPSPLLGKPAPPVQLALLDGGSLDLASHTGQSIVMLDFWATWCGPCVEELPILIKVAEDYRDKGVVLYALNQAEDPEDIKKFLEDEQLTMTVALDSESAVGDEYEVQGIPMLVLVDKQGTVQSVHVGLSPNLEQELRTELDDLLAGKNLAEETLAKAAEKQKPVEAEGLEEVWSADGRYAGVAVDAHTGTIYAVSSRGKITAFDAAGAEQSTFAAPQPVSVLRTARLTPGAGTQLLGFSSWGGAVVAMDTEGTELWQESGGTGIDDVWAADLNGDGQDEVIVGYNGGTGLHVFGADGARRWKYTDIGNVWHVAAGDVVGDSAVEVVTTSAAGQVHLFDGEGQKLLDRETPIYANMVRVGLLKPDSSKAGIIAVGSSDSGEHAVALDSEGTKLWECALPGSSDHCDSFDIAPNAPLAAAGMRGGLVVVIDTTNGEVLAQAPGLGETPQVVWHAGADGSPLLLAASGRSLKAFRVVPKAE